MVIRRGTAEEMLSIWLEPESPTAKFYYNNLISENAEFWTIQCKEYLVAELYFFKHLEDHDFADGKRRGYICAFRVDEDLRGNGLGTLLLHSVLCRMRELGFDEATIGVEEKEEANVRMYEKAGFLTRIKKCNVDLCWVDDKFIPRPCDEYVLLKKNLEWGM